MAKINRQLSREIGVIYHIHENWITKYIPVLNLNLVIFQSKNPQRVEHFKQQLAKVGAKTKYLV
jgi:hypothetical protein